MQGLITKSTTWIHGHAFWQISRKYLLSEPHYKSMFWFSVRFYIKEMHDPFSKTPAPKLLSTGFCEKYSLHTFIKVQANTVPRWLHHTEKEKWNFTVIPPSCPYAALSIRNCDGWAPSPFVTGRCQSPPADGRPTLAKHLLHLISARHDDTLSHKAMRFPSDHQGTLPPVIAFLWK